MKVARESVADIRSKYWQLDQAERRQHLITKLVFDMEANYSSEKIQFRYFAGSIQVCGPFFRALYPLSKQLFSEIRTAVCQRQLNVQPKSNFNITPTKTLSICEFLKVYVDKHGQAIPNKDAIELPSGLSREYVYTEYLASLSEEEIQLKMHAALSTWYHVLHEFHGHLKFPKICAFSQCNLCNRLKTNIEKAESKIEKEKFRKLRQIHLEQAAAERRKYRKHWDKAKSLNPDKYMCMIIDGMTQNTTALPHFKRKPKWMAQHQYDCHVQGIMVAGRNASMEFAYANIKNNANMNITTLHQAIVNEQQRRKDEGRPMPEVLYIQMDNVNSNKSKLLFAYLAVLLLNKVFKKVKVNFLLVGHTHENIDQMFSRVSIALRTVDCLTLNQLMECARSSMQLVPNVTEVNSSFDWKEWLNGCSNNLEDISFNHAFRVSWNSDNKIVLQSRQYAENSSHTWESSEIEVLKSNPSESTPPIEAIEPLSNEQLDSLRYLRSHLRDNMDEAHFAGTVKDYWDSQIRFQEQVIEGGQNVLTNVPFVMPVSHNTFYQAPPITDEAALSAADQSTLALLAPVARPIYTGCRQTQRKETLHLAEDDIFRLESIDDFDVEYPTRQVAIGWAESLTDGFAFTVNLGTPQQPKYSAPLHLLLVKQVEVTENSIKWQWVQPRKFTGAKEQRYVGKQLASGQNQWHTPAGSTEVRPFDKDGIALAWEVDRNEKLAQIPGEQYEKLVKRLRAREIRLAAELIESNTLAQVQLLTN